MAQVNAMAGLNGAQRTRQEILRNRPTGQEVRLKSGPQKSDVYDYDDDAASEMSSMLTAIAHDIQSGQNLNGGTSYQNLSTTRDMVTVNIAASLNSSNSNNVQAQNVKSRVSIAASAYQKTVRYLAGGSDNNIRFSWGTFDTASNAATAFSRSIHGYNGPFPYPVAPAPGGGAPAAVPTRSYSSSQLAIEVQRLVENIEVVAGAEVDVRHVFCQATLNFMRAVIANDGDLCDGQVTWRSRPTGPSDIVNGGQALNLYSSKGDRICDGRYLPIEITESETHLIDGLVFLLGANSSTLKIPVGANGGNDRVPHINQKDGPPIDFGIVVLGNLSQLPRAAYGTPAWGGMVAGVNVANNACARFDLAYLASCMDVLARSLPIADHIEAAGLRVMGAPFAENFHGVAGATNRSGYDEAHSGYNYCFDNGDVFVGGGNVACAIGTQVSGRASVTDKARRRMVHLVKCISSVANIRAVTIQLATIFQLTCRQMGADARTMFPRVAAANVVHADSATEASIDSDLTLHSLMYTPMDGFPNCWGDMSNLIAQIIFGYEIVLSFRFYAYGDSSADATPPLAGLMNVGEVYTSVHPVQVYWGRFKPDAVGLAGIPSRLGMLMMLLAIRANYTSEGAVIPSAINSVVGVGDQMTWNAGEGQLGHAMTLVLDSSAQNTDTYRIELSNVRSAINSHELASAETVTLNLAHVQAFCNAGNTNWATLGIEYRHFPLFADFSMRSRQNLSLRLPSRAAVAMAGNPTFTALVPGYFEASVRAGLDNVAGHFGVYQAPMGRRVRQRREAPPAPTINGGNGGQNGNGNSNGENSQQQSNEQS